MTDFMDNPWAAAERTIFEKIRVATGGTEGKTAFIGIPPPYGNSWSFKIGGGGDARNTFCGPITELMMDADISGTFLERSKAQEFALKVLQALPIKRVGNVQLFELRSGGMPDPKADFITMKNEKEPRLVWVCPIGFTIVFNTVTRANVEPNA